METAKNIFLRFLALTLYLFAGTPLLLLSVGVGALADLFTFFANGLVEGLKKTSFVCAYLESPEFRENWKNYLKLQSLQEEYFPDRDLHVVRFPRERINKQSLH